MPQKIKKMTELYIKINKNANKTSPKQIPSEHWIRSGSRTVLLERALSLALETFPCAMAVFGLLQGLLDRAAFGGDILCRKAPTYCGMIVAIFHGSEKGWKVMPRPFIKARSLS